MSVRQQFLLRDAAPRPCARPFLKWVGGKRQLLPVLLQYAPKQFNTYFEPFVGGGALFFALRPPRAILSDQNHRLVCTYRGVRNDVERVITILRSYPHRKEFYLQLRSEDIDPKADAEIAAWLIYLNKTGYNGLYRVNRTNHFNVPFGDNAGSTICDSAGLTASSQALRSARIEHGDFETIVKFARRGDFVYFDPPYVPLSITSSFTSYTIEGFTMGAQRRLRDVARDLKARGIHVLLSNSASPAVRELYSDFEIVPVPALRRVNSKGAGRGPISEVLIR